MYKLWFTFIFGLKFIHLYDDKFRKPRRIKFKPKIKLDHSTSAWKTHKKNVENCGTDHIGGSRKNIIEREIKIDWTIKRNVNEKKKKAAWKFPPLAIDFLDYYTLLGNCPPTPPLSQHFALSEK